MDVSLHIIPDVIKAAGGQPNMAAPPRPYLRKQALRFMRLAQCLRAFSVLLPRQ